MSGSDMTETATAGRHANRFVDKVVTQIGRKKLILRAYLSGGRLVSEKLYLSTPTGPSSEDRTWFDNTAQAARALELAQDSEPAWLLTRSGSRRPTWDLRR